VCENLVDSELHFVDQFSASLRSGKSVSVASKLGADAGEKRILIEITIDPGGRLLWPPPPTVVRRNDKKMPHGAGRPWSGMISVDKEKLVVEQLTGYTPACKRCYGSDQ